MAFNYLREMTTFAARNDDTMIEGQKGDGSFLVRFRTQQLDKAFGAQGELAALMNRSEKLRNSGNSEGD
ncbi:MAG: hypothetical protein LBC58_00960 [Clostridiales Family XIII bacterium]|jgi:hypothetical protein|nr:hypothetical protein [Clostridiales Family XIII bacterium]